MLKSFSSSRRRYYFIIDANITAAYNNTTHIATLVVGEVRPQFRSGIAVDIYGALPLAHSDVGIDESTVGGVLVCGGTVAYHQGSEGNAIAGAPVAIQERLRVRRIRPLSVRELIINDGIRNSNIATSGNNPMERTFDRAVLNVQFAGDVEQNSSIAVSSVTSRHRVSVSPSFKAEIASVSFS